MKKIKLVITLFLMSCIGINYVSIGCNVSQSCGEGLDLSVRCSGNSTCSANGKDLSVTCDGVTYMCPLVLVRPE